MSDDQSRPTFRDEATALLVDLMEQGVAPWQQPWDAPLSWPYNPVSGTRYRGGNAMWLTVKAHVKGWRDPRWMTFLQAKERGWHIRRGEKGTIVEYWIRSQGQDRYREREIDQNGRPTEHFDQTYAHTDDYTQPALSRPMVRLRTVFNAQQIDGIPPLEITTHDVEVISRGESLIHALGVPIHHDGFKAFYLVKDDKIVLPPREVFHDTYAYYASALHEVGHATGHHTRCGRRRADGTSDLSYAEEEMVAELHAVFACMEAGLPFRPSNHAAYLEHWRLAGNLTSNSVFTAASRAQRALDYLLGMENPRMQKQISTVTQRGVTPAVALTNQRNGLLRWA